VVEAVSFLKDFASKLSGQSLQPEEISLIADLIIIYYAINRMWPTKAQVLAAWEEYKP